jgi:hypothetical protein
VAKIREVVARSHANAGVIAARRAISSIPCDAAVSADYLIVPHMTHREKVYMFSNPFEPESWGVDGENMHDPNEVQYILVQDVTLSPQKRRIVRDLVSSGQFRAIMNSSGVRLYERVGSPEVPYAQRPATGNGLMGVFYPFNSPLGSIPDWRGREPGYQALFPNLDFPAGDGELVSDDGIGTGMYRRFLAVFDGFLLVPESGEYEFMVMSDDGFRLFLDGVFVGEVNTLHAFAETRMKVRLTQGIVPIRLCYFENEPPHGLRLEWRRPGRDDMEIVPATALFPSQEAAEQTLKDHGNIPQ